jgi:hypothetical protein
VATSAVVIVAVLGLWAGCDASGSGDGSTAEEHGEERSSNAASDVKSDTLPESEAPGVEVTADAAARPVACSGGRARTWALEEPALVAGGVGRLFYSVSGLVVDRAGTATVAYSKIKNSVRTADYPPDGADPQNPKGAPGKTYAYYGQQLVVDASGTRTMAFVDADESTGGDGESGNLVFADRPVGGTWMPTARVKDRLVLRIHLVVNSHGAAAVIWTDSDPQPYPGMVGDVRLRAMYRPSAGAPWSKPQRLPVRDFFESFVTIDDAGRVLLAYDVPFGDNPGVYAVRRSKAGTWGARTRLSRGPGLPGGSGHRLFRLEQNADGAAVAVHAPVDGESTATGQVNISRMRPDGTWTSPQRQPHLLGLAGAGIDDRGRVLLAGSAGKDLRVRWSRPDGSWGAPSVIAASTGVTGWGLRPHVVVNRRGEALAAWATKSPAGRITTWYRLKPTHGDWTEPQRLTAPKQPPLLMEAALGDCGHAAFAWTVPGDPRQLYLTSTAPSGPPSRP